MRIPSSRFGIDTTKRMSSERMPFKPHFAWDLLSREEINNRTVRALHNYLSFLKSNSFYYEEQLADISPETLETIEDIEYLPVTTSANIKSSYEEFITVENSVITESFILDDKTILPMTNSDLDRIAYDSSLYFHAMGFNENDRIAIVADHNSELSSAMAFYRGLTAIGANTMRATVNNKETLSFFNPTVMVGTFDTILHVVEKTPLNSLQKLCIVHYENPSVAIEEVEELKEYTCYELLYIETLSTSLGQCSQQFGYHNHPELTTVEVLDENDIPLEDGKEGFLTITPFGITGFPLLRYKTDIRVTKESEKCVCGKNSVRIFPLVIPKEETETESIETPTEEPSDIKEEDTTVSIEDLPYTEQVKHILLELELENFIIEFKGKKDSDDLHVHAQVKPQEVGKIMTVLRERLKRTIPVLVSNRPTIRDMKARCCDDDGYFIDNRL